MIKKLTTIINLDKSTSHISSVNKKGKLDAADVKLDLCTSTALLK